MDRDIGHIEPAHSKWKMDMTLEEEAFANELRAATRPQLSFMRDFRKALGLTQVQVADLLKTTQSNVSKIERAGDMQMSSIVQLAQARRKRITITVENESGEQEAIFALP